MKNIVLWIGVILIPLGLCGETLDFVGPDFEHPYYRIVFPFTITEDDTRVLGIEINGRGWTDYFIFQKARFIERNQKLAAGEYRLHCDFAWAGGRGYEVVVDFERATPGSRRTLTFKGRAPEGAGISDGEDGPYRIFRLFEPLGLAREEEISTLVFAVPRSVFPDGSFVLMDGNQSLDYQILDVRECRPPEKAASGHPVSLTYKIAFPVSIAARARKMLLLKRGEVDSGTGPGFSVETGQNQEGKTVSSSTVSLEFHPRSGQINIITFLLEGIRLFNQAGVIHWNPGVFIPGIAWDHSFNWTQPPSYAELEGPWLYINSRRGPLEKIRDVDLEVKYTMIRGAPYFLSETLLRFNQDLGVVAARNDEMVFYKELFDSYIYKDRSGKIVKGNLVETPGFPDGFVHRAPDDLDWVGLLNTAQNFGFFSLRLEYQHSSLDCAGDWLNKPGTYFYAPADGKYVYWVRPLVYTWAEYSTRNLFSFVPAGSQFYEKNAYLALRLEDGYTERLNEILLRLKNPIRIY